MSATVHRRKKSIWGVISLLWRLITRRKRPRTGDDKPTDANAPIIPTVQIANKDTIISTAAAIAFHTKDVRGPVTNINGHFINGDYTVIQSPIENSETLALTRPPLSQPLPPDIFFGQDELISRLVKSMVDNEQPRIAILGPGGIGKTSVGLHLMHHADVAKIYDIHRYFIGCDAVTSADALGNLVMQAIGVEVPTVGNMVAAMHRALAGAPPTLLLLDNLESLWDTAGANHNAIRELLRQITNGTSASLIITMRAKFPPPGIKWTFFETVLPLSPEYSRELFLAINPTSFARDPQLLEKLLEELGHVPLAIHILAQVSLGFEPEYVMKRWHEEKTSMLSLDGMTSDKLESVDVSISVSIAFLDITRNPEAIQLLGMFCLLPDGLHRWQERMDIIGEAHNTATSAMLRLRQFALIDIFGDKLSVLPPIRLYVLRHHPPDAPHTHCIFNLFWKLVETYALIGFGPDFKGAVEALRPEIGNIGSLVEYAAQYYPSGEIVGIATDYSWHLWRAHRTNDTLLKVADLVPNASTKIKARYWQIFGLTLRVKKKYAEAQTAYTQAREGFLEVGEHFDAAFCLVEMAYMFIMLQSNSAAATIQLAHEEFSALENSLGIFLCLRNLAIAHIMQAEGAKALEAATQARKKALEIDYHLGACQCLQILGDIHIMLENFAEAELMLVEACDSFGSISEKFGSTQCLRSLGQIRTAQREDEEAIACFTKARDAFLDMGFLDQAAVCSQWLDMTKDAASGDDAFRQIILRGRVPYI